MCWYEHQRLFCPCTNVDCKAPRGRCRCPEKCSEPDTEGRRGHLLDKCTADKYICEEWRDEQTKVGGLYDPKHCPEYDSRPALKVVGLCKKCRKDCADKQAGPDAGREIEQPGPNPEKKNEQPGPDSKKKKKEPSSFSCCTVS